MQEMGLKVFTNSTLRKPVLCNEDKLDWEENRIYFEHGASGGSAFGKGKSQNHRIIETWKHRMGRDLKDHQVPHRRAGPPTSRSDTRPG